MRAKTSRFGSCFSFRGFLFVSPSSIRWISTLEAFLAGCVHYSPINRRRCSGRITPMFSRRNSLSRNAQYSRNETCWSALSVDYLQTMTTFFKWFYPLHRFRLIINSSLSSVDSIFLMNIAARGLIIHRSSKVISNHVLNRWPGCYQVRPRPSLAGPLRWKHFLRGASTILR